MGPTILTLPYAFRGLGWGLGFFCLTAMAIVTFYSYYLMSKVLEHSEKAGRRHIRFRELAADVLGNTVTSSCFRKYRKYGFYFFFLVLSLFLFVFVCLFRFRCITLRSRINNACGLLKGETSVVSAYLT